MEAAATAKGTTSNLKRKKFRWDDDIVQHLINSLLEYRRLMTYKNLAFDADKPVQSKEIRTKMASIYANQDQSLCCSSNADIDDNSKTNENVPLTESYVDFDENLDDDGDDYDLSVNNYINSKPPVPMKNKLNNVSQVIDNKRKHLQKKLSSAQRELILLTEVKE